MKRCCNYEYNVFTIVVSDCLTEWISVKHILSEFFAHLITYWRWYTLWIALTKLPIKDSKLFECKMPRTLYFFDIIGAFFRIRFNEWILRQFVFFYQSLLLFQPYPWGVQSCTTLNIFKFTHRKYMFREPR